MCGNSHEQSPRRHTIIIIVVTRHDTEMETAGASTFSRAAAVACQSPEAGYSGEDASQFMTKDRPELLDDDDCISVRCKVAIRRPSHGRGAVSDLHWQLDMLLAGKDGVDVTSEVVASGETFLAHRCVLAAWSPVFRAQLFGFGRMKESKHFTSCGVPIPIDGMDAQVFRARSALHLHRLVAGHRGGGWTRRRSNCAVSASPCRGV